MADPLSSGINLHNMEREKIQLIIETIESQIKLLKLELGETTNTDSNKLEIKLEDLIKSDPFAAYDPSYHEED